MKILVLLAAGLVSSAQTPRWDDMVWVALPIGDRVVEKAVLAVSVHVDGLQGKALMQLDLGTNGTVLYGAAYRALGGKAVPENGRIRVSGTVAGLRFENQSVLLDAKQGEAPKPGEPAELGTVGADFFNQRGLVMDFVRNKVAAVEKGGEWTKGVSFAPLRYRNGKVFVTVRMGGREESGFFYDTGSSALPLVTTRGRWMELTGRRPEDAGNTVWKVKSWGNDAALVGARMSGPLCVGTACVEGPMVYFESSGLENLRFDKYPYPAEGLIGNAVFLDQYSVVVDLAGQRLGLVKGSLAGRE
ncbi:MAG: hypothetical protein U0R19_05825 [Bryobacteraceae bacterium]